MIVSKHCYFDMCIINNRDVVTSYVNVYSKFKMVAHTVVEEPNAENKPTLLR